MKKKLIASLLALLFCFSLVACAQSGGGSGSGSSSSSSSGSDSDFEYIKGNGKIIVGYTVYAPMNYTDNAGNFVGFDTELTEKVCAKLGFKPDFVEIDWGTKEIELAAKSIDCIWNGLTITEERKQNMSITIPYVKNAQVVVMKADAAYSGTSSLVGKTVCAEAGSAGEETIADDDNLQKAVYIAKDVQTSCLMEVAAGTADAAVLDLTLAKAMTGAGTDYANLEIKDRLAVEDYGIAFRKGSDVTEKVNEILRGFVADGTLKALADKYSLDLA